MACFALAALATRAEPRTVSTATYHRTFSLAHPAPLRVKPGDSTGAGEWGEGRIEPFSSGQKARGRGFKE